MQDPEHGDNRGDAEQRRAQWAVPGALLDERDEDADDGEAEQADADRIELGALGAGLRGSPAGGSGAPAPHSAPTGRLTKKTARQPLPVPKIAIRAPPSSGPIAVDTPTTVPK